MVPRKPLKNRNTVRWNLKNVLLIRQMNNTHRLIRAPGVHSLMVHKLGVGVGRQEKKNENNGPPLAHMKYHGLVPFSVPGGCPLLFGLQ